MDEQLSWFSVRCVFALAGVDGAETTYEERITLWKAASDEEAIARAEAEAEEYADFAGEDGGEIGVAGLFQSYRLVDEPGDGAEVFSLMRDSALQPDDYLDTFFDTGRERETKA